MAVSPWFTISIIQNFKVLFAILAQDKSSEYIMPYADIISPIFLLFYIVSVMTFGFLSKKKFKNINICLIALITIILVLFLKVPDTYGEEIVNHDSPANGHLEFIGGAQHSLSMSQIRLSPKVGDFFVFPYTLVHAVYPFKDTDQVRRTLSYNCDILPKVMVKAK